MKMFHIVWGLKVNKKTINRMILATWILLLCCFIFKIFSNDLFVIMINNEKFIEIATKIDCNVWLQALTYMPYVLIGNTLLLLAIIGEKHKSKKTIFIIIACIIFEYLLKVLMLAYLINYAVIINLILDILLIFFVPFYFNRDYLECIKGQLINLGMQSISMLVRNIAIKVLLNDTITSMILALDVILMYVLYYLYRKKEV